MILDCPTAEALSQVAADDGWARVAGFQFTKATLTGVIELSRTVFHAGSEARAAVSASLALLPEERRLSDSVIAMLGGEFEQSCPQGHLFSAPTCEVWLVRGPACLESTEFSLFVQRFGRSLSGAGFGIRFPLVLSQAMIEMAENVVRHSGASGAAPALGVVGYHVTPETMTYVAADLGRGVLSSLRENPKWRRLDNDTDALIAAAKDGATRSAHHTEGDGFRLAFQGFLDREGVIATRSGDGVVRLHGNLDGREAEAGNGAPLPGLRMAAWLKLAGGSEETTFRH